MTKQQGDFGVIYFNPDSFSSSPYGSSSGSSPTQGNFGSDAAAHRDEFRALSVSTRLVHPKPLRPGDPMGGEVQTTSSYVLNRGGVEKDHHSDYARCGNKNGTLLEAQCRTLENSKHALAFNSGVAAIHGVCDLLKEGDVVIAEANTYGCTIRLFNEDLKKRGVKIVFLDFTDPASLEEVRRLKPTMVWFESVTNPVLKVLPAAEIAKAAKSVGALVVVDNTFATAYNILPLDLGADISLTSVTKWMGGHSNATGGIVCTNDDGLAAALAKIRTYASLGISPAEAHNLSMGLQTFVLRFERQAQNSIELAQFLENHSLVKKVIYPGLPSHPDHDLTVSQMKNGGAVLAVEFNVPAGFVPFLVEALAPMFTTAHSLGSTKSQVSIPALMSHSSVPKEERLAAGVTDTLVRISPGIEEGQDLIAFLRERLARVPSMMEKWESRKRPQQAGLIAHSISIPDAPTLTEATIVGLS